MDSVKILNLQNIKGDHLVGKYYVKFNTVYNKQVNDLVKKVMH